ncbi:hypothetical protein RsTz2092_11090 [Deferribacterales bacterium RsTz2092]
MVRTNQGYLKLACSYLLADVARQTSTAVLKLF